MIEGNPADNLRIGRFRSSPWAPYYPAAAWDGVDGVDWVDCVSSGVRPLAEAGRLDVTPMATVDWFDLSHRFKRIGNFGLAFHGEARSVLLFSHRRIEELDAATIAVSTETTTSVRLLRAILARKYDLTLGLLIPVDDDLPATTPRLLIQDEALEEQRRGRYPFVYDLGREWWSWQRTPVVPAVWVARADLSTRHAARAKALLHAALRWSEASPDAMAAAFVARHPPAMTSAELLALVRNFRYRLGPMEEHGLLVMEQLLEPRAAIVNAYRLPEAK